MATPIFSNSITVPGLGYDAMEEVNHALRLIREEGEAAFTRFSRSPPLFRTQSSTPYEVNSSDEKEEDPALLKALEETARRLPIEWAKRRAHMTEEEKEESRRWKEDFDQRTARREQEQKEMIEKFFASQPVPDIFKPRAELLQTTLEERAPTRRKRKRDAKLNTASRLDMQPVKAVRKPVGRPRKSARIAAISQTPLRRSKRIAEMNARRSKV